MRATTLTMSAALLLTALTAGCSDSSNSRPSGPTEPPEIPEPEVSLDETGVYSGTLATDSGGLALMRLTLGRDGTTAISLDGDDDERPNAVLFGASTGDNGVIDFTGNNPGDGAEVVVTITIDGDSAVGELSLVDWSGSFSLALDSFSDGDGTLQALAGDYAREDNLGGLTTLSIANDGTVQVSGSCDAEGSVAAIDEAVNIYRLQVDGDCLALDALLSREAVVEQGDVLAISGQDSGDSFAIDFYRP